MKTILFVIVYMLILFSSYAQHENKIATVSNPKLISLVQKFIDTTRCYVSEKESKYVIIRYQKRGDSTLFYDVSIYYMTDLYLHGYAFIAMGVPITFCKPISEKKIILYESGLRNLILHDEKKFIAQFKDDFPDIIN